MKHYTLKLKTTQTTKYNLYEGTTLVSDSDLTTLFATAGEAYFQFDFDSKTPSNKTSLTILDSQDTAVITKTGLTGIAEDKNFKGTWSASATALDSFGLLTGKTLDEAELSSLVGMIKTAGASGIKTLTTEDYNYPTTGTKNCIALWLLPFGVYLLPGDIPVRTSRYGNPVTRQECVVIKFSDYNYLIGGNASGGLEAYHNDANGQVPNVIIGENTLVPAVYTVDNLTSTYTNRPLSSNQGKVLKDLIDSLVIKNAGAPTTSTTGSLGQLLIDTTNAEVYQLKSIGSNPTAYNWEKLGGGGGSNILSGTVEPDASLGNDGDLYCMYVSHDDDEATFSLTYSYPNGQKTVKSNYSEDQYQTVATAINDCIADYNSHYPSSDYDERIQGTVVPPSGPQDVYLKQDWNSWPSQEVLNQTQAVSWLNSSASTYGGSFTYDSGTGNYTFTDSSSNVTTNTNFNTVSSAACSWISNQASAQGDWWDGSCTFTANAYYKADAYGEYIQVSANIGTFLSSYTQNIYIPNGSPLPFSYKYTSSTHTMEVGLPTAVSSDPVTETFSTTEALMAKCEEVASYSTSETTKCSLEITK